MATRGRRMPQHRPRVGVSACLLGEKVRYDGGHKLHPAVVGELADIFEWVPVCPEVEGGLGNPRPPMRLVKMGSSVRLRVIHDDRDVTRRVESTGSRRILQLIEGGLAGFVLKSRSPSCGWGSVEVVGDGAQTVSDGGTGVFAGLLMKLAPELPLIEETALQNVRTRGEFIDRVRRRWRQICAQVSRQA